MLLFQEKKTKPLTCPSQIKRAFISEILFFKKDVDGTVFLVVTRKRAVLG